MIPPPFQNHLLKQRQMPRMYRNTLRLVLSSFSHKQPVPLLPKQVETSSLWDEYHGQAKADKSKSIDDPEFCARANMIVQDSSRQRSTLPHYRR